MFQFTDDIDEDVLSISTNQIANGNISNMTNNTSVVESTSAKNDSNIALEDFDEDDLILSAAFEDASNSFCENRKSTSPVLKTILPERSTSTQISHSRNSGYVSSPVVSKHKSPYSVNSPHSIKYSKIQYERRFPGPAGLIPKKSNENFVMSGETVPSMSQQEFDSALSSINMEKYNKIIVLKIAATCTKSMKNIETHETDNFCDSNVSWKALLNDVNSNENKLLQRMDDFTVHNVNRLNLVKETSWKIPIFGAVIFNIDSSVSDPCVTLRDPSGEIMGTLDKDLWDQYNHLLLVGSALLLRQVTVLCLINSRKLYLNITINNIVTIYTLPKGDEAAIITQVRTVSETDFLNESKTEHSRKSNSPASSMKNSCSSLKTRSNADLLNLIKNSNMLNSSDASRPSIKNCVLDCKSKSVDANKSSANLKSCDKASVIFNELEGLDADSFFGDF